MKKYLLLVFCSALFTPCFLAAQSNPDHPIRVIVFGAHPDDCDIETGGLAALYTAAGHKVKFVSLTNGDMGHQDIGGGDLARRRLAEAKESGRRLGVEYEVLDNHDAELVPSLENRLKIIRLIREWNADIVISSRPNDYHPDHRNTGILVQDAAYLVIVPNVLSSVPPLKKNPVFLYVRDYFQRPNPFRPDIAVDITGVYDKKINALDAHVSQVYEWLPWTEQQLDQVPKDATARKTWLAKNYAAPITPEIRASLEKWYGKVKAPKVVHAEAYEICEYGRRPSEEEIRQLFPMLK